MEKNNSSNYSICRKIRQALASSPAFRAIHRISRYRQEPSRPVITDSHPPSSFPTHLAKNTATQTRQHPLPQHLKVNTEGAAPVPIKFDYSTPASMGNGKSAASMAHGQAAKIASPLAGNSERAAKVESEPQYYVPRQGKPPTKAVGFPTNQGIGHGIRAAAFKEEDNGKPKAENPGLVRGQHGLGLQSEQHGKKPLDINDTFDEYIQRTRYRIRTVSNIGRGQGNLAPDEANGINKKDNQKDHFSDFIHLAKKKIRTTSNIGKTSSLKREQDRGR